MAAVNKAELVVELGVGAGDWPPLTTLRCITRAAASAAAASVPDFPSIAEVSVLFTNDARMADLNAAWRGKAGPTNVLSFPAPALPSSPEATVSIGDIVLGCETVTKEAAQMHLTLADHISHLFVHGLLHLIGFDHDDDREAVAMEQLETAILAKLGIADPYAGSEPELISTAGSNGR
jgi:probable rRNA maturation factor